MKQSPRNNAFSKALLYCIRGLLPEEKSGQVILRKKVIASGNTSTRSIRNDGNNDRHCESAKITFGIKDNVHGG